MSVPKERFLTPTEAAVVASVSVRNVHRAIDERILPESLCLIGHTGRLLRAEACVFLSFYFETANRLTAEERLRMIAAASQQQPEEPWTIRQDFLTIDLAPFSRAVQLRLARLDAANVLVVEDPEILSGTPVLRGTRVPAYDIASMVAAGDSLERILKGFPSITAEMVELAALYAKANPQLGRPRQSTSLPPGAVIVSSGRVSIHRAGQQKLAS